MILDIILSTIILALVIVIGLYLFNNKKIAKEYELMIADLMSHNRELIQQVIKISLSKNIVEYSASKQLEEPMEIMDNMKENEFVPTESADASTFEKMIQAELHPEDEEEIEDGR